LTSKDRKYTGPVARRLREKANRKVLPLARDANYYQRALRFLDEFKDFATRMMRAESVALSGSETPVVSKSILLRSVQEWLADEEMLELYITSLTTEGDVAGSVPGEARRYLSAARVRLGHSSIVNSSGVIGDVVRAHKRKTPRQRRQAESLHEDDVADIVSAYGCSRSWWRVQIACMMSVGFVALQRLGELRRIPLNGVRFVMVDGRDVNAAELSRMPRVDTVKGAFLHIDWTKANQTHDAWMAISCRMTLKVLLRHVGFLRRSGRTDGPLFPSRQYKGGDPTDREVDAQSVRVTFRKALREVCGYDDAFTKADWRTLTSSGGVKFLSKTGDCRRDSPSPGGMGQPVFLQRLLPPLLRGATSYGDEAEVSASGEWEVSCLSESGADDTIDQSGGLSGWITTRSV
jgi:hypothetical protein